MNGVLNGFVSSSFHTDAAAPQDSILGSTLYLNYINDLYIIKSLHKDTTFPFKERLISHEFKYSRLQTTE